jgi:hypothetical protein
MADLKITKEAAGRKVVFRGSEGKTVDQLNQAQLRDLAKIGVLGNDKTITSLFEGQLPTADDFRAEDAEAAKKNVKPAANNSNKPAQQGNNAQPNTTA